MECVPPLTRKIDHFLPEKRIYIYTYIHIYIYIWYRDKSTAASLLFLPSHPFLRSVRASFWSAKDPITPIPPLIFPTWPSILSRIFGERWYYTGSPIPCPLFSSESHDGPHFSPAWMNFLVSRIDDKKKKVSVYFENDCENFRSLPFQLCVNQSEKLTMENRWPTCELAREIRPLSPPIHLYRANSL